MDQIISLQTILENWTSIEHYGATTSARVTDLIIQQLQATKNAGMIVIEYISKMKHTIDGLI